MLSRHRAPLVSSFPVARAEAVLHAQALSVTVRTWSWSHPDPHSFTLTQNNSLGFFFWLGNFCNEEWMLPQALHAALSSVSALITHRGGSQRTQRQPNQCIMTTSPQWILWCCPPHCVSPLLELPPSLLETQRSCSASAQSIGTATKANSCPRGAGPHYHSIHTSKQLLALLRMLQQPM